MKAIKTRTTIVCMSLVVMGLLLTVQSYAQSDEALVVAYLFDEGEGDTAIDLSGNGHDGTIEGGAEYVDDGKFGKAISLDGTGWIEVPEIGTFDEFTIITWISGPAPQGAVNGGIFYDDGWRDGLLHYATWEGKVAFGVAGMAPTGFTDIRIEDEWLHLVSVYSAGEKWVEVYADGELDRKTELDTAPPVILGPAGIGSWKNMANVNERFWTGMFDEFAIFDEVLEQDQIQNIMNNGLENRAAVSPADGSATTWGQIKYE